MRGRARNPAAGLASAGLRWLLAGTLVATAHGAAVWLAIEWQPRTASAAEPPPAMMIELAPLAVTPDIVPIQSIAAAESTEATPEPQPEAAEPQPPPEPPAPPEPPQPEPAPPEPPKPAPPPPPEPEMPLPEAARPDALPAPPKAEPPAEPPKAEPPKAEPPKETPLPRPPEPKRPEAKPPEPEPRKPVPEVVKQKPKPAKQKKPKPVVEKKLAARPESAVAPRAAEAQAAKASRSAAPVSGAGVKSVSPASWKSRLLAQLNRHKRFPRGAGSGTASVAFTIDRQGRVLSARLANSSGDAVLDREAVGLLRRAGPLPPPPEGFGGSRIGLTVPIRFSR